MDILEIWKKVWKYSTDEAYRFDVNSILGFHNTMPDEEFLCKQYQLKMKKPLDLQNPCTFNEKLQWLKIFDHRPEYTLMVEKYEVKTLVAQKIGLQYVIPTLGVWNHFDDIEFDTLPNQFVLKCTHDSGSVILVDDKNQLDIRKAKRIMEKFLGRNLYYYAREWPYKNVPPRIIAEPYLKNDSGEGLIDYKFYCFHGVPMYCQVIANRWTGETIDFFDMGWNHQEFTGLALPYKPFSTQPITQPVTLDEMKTIATRLSAGIVFLRVDMYEINGRVYFGEITFYPSAGLGEFYPAKWNRILGDMIHLPTDAERHLEQ